MKLPYFIAIGLISVGLVACLWTYSRAAGNTITACVEKDGDLYLIGAGLKRAECKKNDTLFSWNIIGPQGPKGDNGDTGAAGEKGEKGDPGSSGGIKVFDANNQILGILDYHAGHENTVFNSELKRFVYLSREEVRNYTAAVYASSNCTGVPYSPLSPSEYYNKASDLMAFGNGVYYIFNDNAVVETITTGSQKFFNPPNSFTCVPDVRTSIPAYKMTAVTLPFTVPLALPLKFSTQ